MGAFYSYSLEYAQFQSWKQTCNQSKLIPILAPRILFKNNQRWLRVCHSSFSTRSAYFLITFWHLLWFLCSLLHFSLYHDSTEFTIILHLKRFLYIYIIFCLHRKSWSFSNSAWTLDKGSAKTMPSFPLRSFSIPRSIFPIFYTVRFLFPHFLYPCSWSIFLNSRIFLIFEKISISFPSLNSIARDLLPDDIGIIQFYWF